MATYDDPRILRAIAHPTRNRVLHELSAGGSLRAADIARRIDIPANQASFHLRQLAKYGLVEEDPDAARDRRDRVWRLTDSEGIRIRPEEMIAQPGGEAAYAVFRRNAVEWGHRLVDRAFVPRESGDERKKSSSEYALRLTSEEAEQLTAELDQVMRRWQEQTRAASDGGRETYAILQLILPYPGLPEPPARGDD